MTNMPPLGPGSQAPKGNLVLFERMISVKKLLAVLMTMAVAVILGMGNVGCSKKDETKKTEKTEVTKEGKTETKSKVETETTTKPK
jgi:hypothetical protein